MYGVAGEHLTERLRRLMFQKLLQQEIAFYDNKGNSTGALCARLSGEAAAVQGVRICGITFHFYHVSLAKINIYSTLIFRRQDNV